MGEIAIQRTAININDRAVLLVGGPKAGDVIIVPKIFNRIFFAPDGTLLARGDYSGRVIPVNAAKHMPMSLRMTSYTIVGRTVGDIQLDLATCNGDNLDMAIMAIFNFYASENQTKRKS